MLRLLLFFYQYRAFILFLVIEGVCLFLIIQNNKYQSASYYNSSTAASGWVLSTSGRVKDYFALQEINDNLAIENARLLNELQKLKYPKVPSPEVVVKDSALLDQFKFISAKVINNSTGRYNNYITINKGYEDGIMPGMGVISSRSVVGKVKYTSKHYSTVSSLLHADVYVSSVIKSNGAFGSLKWDGRNSRFASLLFIPRHVSVKVGDTITTSGYSTIFPAGLMIGVVKNKDLKSNSPFYDIRVQLAVDFTRLSYVAIIQNKFKPERDSLENLTGGGAENEQ